MDEAAEEAAEAEEEAATQLRMDEEDAQAEDNLGEDSEKTEEEREELDPRIPKTWDVPRSDARVGRFAVVEAEWDHDEIKGGGQDLKGIAVFRVPFVVLFCVFDMESVMFMCF